MAKVSKSNVVLCGCTQPRLPVLVPRSQPGARSRGGDYPFERAVFSWSPPLFRLQRCSPPEPPGTKPQTNTLVWEVRGTPRKRSRHVLPHGTSDDLGAPPGAPRLLLHLPPGGSLLQRHVPSQERLLRAETGRGAPLHVQDLPAARKSRGVDFERGQHVVDVAGRCKS